MNNDNFLIENSDLELVKNVCSYIENPSERNIAFANSLAAKLAAKYFEELDVDTTTGLHNSCIVLKDLEIADIYIKGSFINVRLYFNENEICVPKRHFDDELLPVAYMFIKIDQEVSNGSVTGFITPAAIDTTKDFKGYYPVKEEDLVSFYDIEPLLVTQDSDDLPENFETQIFDYLDGKIENCAEFYKKLLTSKYAREIFLSAATTQTIFDFVSVTSSTQDNDDSSEITSVSDEVDSIEELDSTESFDLLEENDDFELSTEGGTFEDLEESEPEMLEELPVTDLEEVEAINTDIEDSSDELEIVDTTDIEPTEDTIEETLIDETENDILEPVEDNFEVSETLEEEIPTEESQVDVNNETSISDNVEVLTVIDSEDEEDAFTEEIAEYSTSTTPSIETIENGTEQDFDFDALESLLEEEATNNMGQESLNAEKGDEEEIPNTSIEELYGSSGDEIENTIEDNLSTTNKKSKSLIPMLGLLTVIGALGYYGYTKFINPEVNSNEIQEPVQTIVKENKQATKTPIAMPDETVENIEAIKPTNEGTAEAIPAIEQNLDASILVSNLAVNWEVPAGYVSNNTAKRYFVKMGKIVQLNLKTELLLLSKPPITNKIALELEFNKNTNKFDVKGITVSSGEKSVDEVILQTVKNALGINLSMNMSTFANISGNPILVIRL